MANVITIKFLKPIGIGISSGGMLTPNLYPTSKTVPGFTAPISAQDYDLENDEYEVKLLDESPSEVPDHLKDLDPEIKKAFQVQQATLMAANHAANNATRLELKVYEKEGIIKIVHDGIKDGERKGGSEKSKEWRTQDANQNKRLNEDSLDVKSAKDMDKEPHPHMLRTEVAGDANARAAAERDKDFGGADKVPTTKDPEGKAKDKSDKK